MISKGQVPSFKKGTGWQKYKNIFLGSMADFFWGGTLKWPRYNPDTVVEILLHYSKGAKNLHMNWVDKFGVKKNDAHAINYAPMFAKASKADTVKAFREREGKTPWDLLR
jgi:hypothetical protein